ncbi:MAG: ATP-binding cassette domain-containing protein [Candidatus Bathyarchaeota archaeon]|jgi:ABC-2 type transport system ATP-binding protein|nr:MAG: ATP-binding cassette domain-containing protein [Candidatus Bathyarchaeota archaeon]
MTKVIEVENLSKIYKGNIKAVDDISFDVNAGELFGFLGPNGAGKTTTIKLLTTLASITSGKATVLGYDVTKHPNMVRKSIGIVPQDLTIDNELKGIENAMLAAKLYRVPNQIAKKRVKNLLELVGLNDAASRLVSTYSGGMRKRLELIVGLVHEPKVLFMDEPTLGLDVNTRKIIWDYIRKLNIDKGVTIFMTTHYLEEADALCDVAAIIDRGKIRAQGSPQELKEIIGGELLTIELTKDRDLQDFFSSINGVKEVKKSGSTYGIKLGQAEDAIPVIIEGIYGRGIKIKALSCSKPSLDQVFLEVTGKEFREEEFAAAALRRQDIIARRG